MFYVVVTVIFQSAQCCAKTLGFDATLFLFAMQNCNERTRPDIGTDIYKVLQTRIFH